MAQAMIARLFKDMTAGDAHTTSAGVGGKKRKAAPGLQPVTMKEKFASVLKVDAGHGLVLGWAIVCKIGGEDHFDLQSDHIPEEAMLAASVDFMGSGRVAKEMHAGEGVGTILFAFPLTTDIAKAFDLKTDKTGLMIAMRPDSPEMLAKFADGTFTGFSIGGFRLEDEEVA